MMMMLVIFPRKILVSTFLEDCFETWFWWKQLRPSTTQITQARERKHQNWMFCPKNFYSDKNLIPHLIDPFLSWFANHWKVCIINRIIIWRVNQRRYKSRWWCFCACYLQSLILSFHGWRQAISCLLNLMAPLLPRSPLLGKQPTPPPYLSLFSFGPFSVKITVFSHCLIVDFGPYKGGIIHSILWRQKLFKLVLGKGLKAFSSKFAFMWYVVKIFM